MDGVLPSAILDVTCPIDWTHPLNRGLVGEWAVSPLAWNGSKVLRNLTRPVKIPQDGTLSGAKWSGTSRPNGFGQLIIGNSGNQNIDFGKPFTGNANFSFGGWFYLQSLTGTNQQFNLFGWANSNIAGSGILLEMGSSNATVPHAWQVQQNNTGWSTAGQISAVAGIWTFVVVTWNSSSGGVLYVNGVVSSTATTSVGNPGSGSDLIVGNPSAWQSVAWHGNVDGLFFYNRVLSANEVAALYDQSRRGNPDRWNWLKPVTYFGVTAGAPTFTVSGTGGSVVGSTATSSPAWTPAPSGGAVDGSSATAAPTWNMAPSGGVVDGSSGTAAPSWTQSPSGGSVGGSDAGFAATWNTAPSGGAVAGSGGTAAPSWTPTPSGGAVEGSGASASQSGGVFTVSGTGGGVVGSSVAAVPTWTWQAVGGTVAAGLATVLQIAPPVGVEVRWLELARALLIQEQARGLAWQELARALSRVPGMTAAIQRPGETRTYTIDMSALDEIAAGDLIASVGSASQAQWPTPAPGVPAGSPLSLGAPVAALSNKGVAIQVSGPAASGGYEVRVPVMTQSGAVLVGVLLIKFTWNPYGSLET